MTPAPVSPVRVYRESCIDCHDTDGRGGAGRDLFRNVPDFTDAGWQASRTDAALARSILDGKGKSMPRMRDKLGSLDVGPMVAFVRAFQGGKQVVDDDPPAPAPEATAVAPAVAAARTAPRHAEGAGLFQRFCAMCHGADGRGTGPAGNGPGIPDFTLRAWQDRRGDAQLAVSILDGKGAVMPAFRGKLGTAQARELVAFIRGFDPSRPVASAPAEDDFEPRYRALREEFDDLSRQIRALAPPPRTSSATRR